MPGTSPTLESCAASWAVARPRWRGRRRSSVPARGRSCWTISSAAALRPPCRSAPIYPGMCTTVTTLKMLASPARCRDFSRARLSSPGAGGGRTNLALVYYYVNNSFHIAPPTCKITNVTIYNYVLNYLCLLSTL